MFKIRVCVVFVAVFLFSFCEQSFCFSQEIVSLKPKYPDYSYEFAGKDSWEGFNRKIFIFNSKLNKCVIRPVNIVWASVMPKYGIERIKSAYTNTEFPIRFVSCLCQKDFKGSKTELARFLINTTVGVGGLYDPAKTKFKMEPKQEDMAQALAHTRLKSGPFVVLPVITPGKVRDMVGELLDYALTPTSYFIGPVAMAAKAALLVNGTTSSQPLLKAIDNTYADPYEVTKKLCCVEKYIKNSNFDRKEVLDEKITAQNLIKVSNIPCQNMLNCDLKLNNYNPQGPITDSLRTAFFDVPKMNDDRWSELSVWNRGFNKQIKTGFVSLSPKRSFYKFRYILQKDKSAPLAIVYPSIGEGVTSYHSAVIAKLFYDKGYSVLIQGSPFHWEFVKSMPKEYRPGFPSQDAAMLRGATSTIIENIQKKPACKNSCQFERKVLIGTSFGAMTTLFVAQQEEREKLFGNKVIGISDYISISPPVDIFFAMKQFDNYSQEWANDSSDIKERAALTAQKVLIATQEVSYKKDNVKNGETSVSLPFNEDEAKLIVGFIMKQKLSDLVFTIENASKARRSGIYDSINQMSFRDYAQKYLLINNINSEEQLHYDNSLYAIIDFLKRNRHYKIYHATDDFFVNQEQLAWLKENTGNKTVFISNGSHLGFLYRKEFIDSLMQDMKFEEKSNPKGL